MTYVTGPTSSGTSGTATVQSTTGTTSATAAQASIDFNSFLKMMIAEMQNQDPTAPSDPTQYLTQLSQMTGVQQGILTNTKLDSLLTSTAISQADNLIGKTVTSADGSVSGVVTSVALSSGGSPTATLANGSTLTLDNTITVSAS